MSTTQGRDDDRIARYDHDGLTFEVIDSGPLDGDAVVLLHGFPERAAGWSSVTERLNARGLRTFAPDQRGYSPGARPRRRRDHRLELLVGDVAALVERIGRPVHLVGHDWGAVVGWTLVAERPDLVRSWTAMSVPHPAAYVSALAGPQLLDSWYVLGFLLPGLPERLLSSHRGERLLRGGGMTREDVARFRPGILDDGALRGGLMWYRALPFHRPGAVRARVTVPTTFVWSDGDDFVSRTAAERCRAHVDGDYRHVELRGRTHWLPTQAPDEVAEAILTRVRTAR